MRLTKKVVDAASGTDKAVVIWDDKLTGFGLRILPSGLKSFVVDYTTESGRRRRMTIGRYPVVTSEAARAKAQTILEQVARGLDPLEKAQEAKAAPTVKDFSEEYLRRWADVRKKPSSAASDRLLLKHILPAMGPRKLDSITRADVAKLHSSMDKLPTQANRVLSLLSKMFNLAEAWGYRPDNTNPTRHIERYKETARQRYLTAEELGRLGAALDRHESDYPVDVRAVRLILLSGMRRGEVLGLRWSEVDFDRGLLHLADSKTGPKDVVLGAAALQLLRDAPRDGEWVIPSERRGGMHRDSVRTLWNKARDEAQLSGVRLHDLRHGYAAAGASGGMSLTIIGGLLGHTQARTTMRYAHLAPSPLHAAADTIAAEIEAALAKREPAEVIDIATAAKR